MGEEKKYIPNKLKRCRKLSGYKQNEVSRLLGLKSSARLAKWEKGKSFPSVLNLLKLSALYSTLANDLYIEIYLKFKNEVKHIKPTYKRKNK